MMVPRRRRQYMAGFLHRATLESCSYLPLDEVGSYFMADLVRALNLFSRTILLLFCSPLEQEQPLLTGRTSLGLKFIYLQYNNYLTSWYCQDRRARQCIFHQSNCLRLLRTDLQFLSIHYSRKVIIVGQSSIFIAVQLMSLQKIRP